MVKVYLKRIEESEQGTFGVLCVPEVGFSCYTAELPWRDNKQNESCIPKGKYELVPFSSESHPDVYEVHNVKARGSILIHVGNYAGDTSKGYKSDTGGCILLGKSLGYLGKQRAVISSRDTVKKFVELTKKYPLQLIIE